MISYFIFDLIITSKIGFCIIGIVIGVFIGRKLLYKFK